MLFKNEMLVIDGENICRAHIWQRTSVQTKTKHTQKNLSKLRKQSQYIK